MVKYHHLQKRKLTQINNNPASAHLLFCNHSAYFDNFSIVTCKNKRFLLELKEILLKIRVQLSLNKIIASLPLYLFHTP